VVVLNGWRETIHMLYEQVEAKIIIVEGISKSFNIDIEVKQGCPLSLTHCSVFT
jgi:hypothetical protein